MDSTLLTGLKLSAAGMSLVFGVLALLWMLIALLERLDRRQAHKEVTVTEAEAEAPLTAGHGIASDLAAAITVAVLAHREERRREAGPEVRSHQPGALPSRWVGTGRTRQTEGWEPGRRTR